MTSHKIGTAASPPSHREECDQWITRLANHQSINAKLIDEVRRDLGSELAALVVNVAALQAKAEKKFGPGVWWVTERALQQATPWQVAQLKANWLGHERVYDLCCGAGGDAIQLAKRGPVVAVDQDESLVAMVTENLIRSTAASEHALAICGDAVGLEVPASASVHIDPDRRAGGNRSSRPDQYSPVWSDVCAIVRNSQGAVVKLAPAAKPNLAGMPETHQTWISLGGSVREQSLLVGRTVGQAGLRPGARSAVVLRNDGAAAWFMPCDGDSNASYEGTPADTSNVPLGLLVDPNAAIRAAGLTEAFARDHSLKVVGAASGFLTGNDMAAITPSVSALAAIGKVIWTGPCDDRKLRKELRSRDSYPQAIKVRGTDHDPSKLAKRYRHCGDRPVTLWIGRAANRVFAALTDEQSEPLAVRQRAIRTQK